MTIDLAERRAELLRLRENIVRAAGDLAADDEGVGEINTAAGDQHLADHASDLVDLELDQSLGENADNVVAEIDEALDATRRRHVRHLLRLRRHDSGGAAGRRPVRHALPRRQAPPGTRLSESARPDPPRRIDVRVGSSTNALQPVSSAERRLGAGLAQWVALLVIAGTAIAADQLTKSIVSMRLPIGDAVATIGPFSIHHVQNSGIAFGLFAHSTTAVIVLTGAAVAAMLVFFSRSGAASSAAPGRARARDRRQRRQPDRPGAARSRHRLPRLRLLAGVQSRRHLHRRGRRAAVRLVRGVRQDEPAPWHGSAFTFLSTTPGRGSIAFSPCGPSSTRARSPSA